MPGYVYRGSRTAPESKATNTVMPSIPRDSTGAKKREGCGTEAGYLYHRGRREKACEECALAHKAEYPNGYGTIRKVRTVRPPCGTYSGFRAHERRKEPKCDPCRTAFNKWRRENRTDRKPKRKEKAPNVRIQRQSEVSPQAESTPQATDHHHRAAN